MTKSFFLCTSEEINPKGYFIKFIEEIKDEVIAFVDKDKTIKVFSSICPHFGGEIYYSRSEDLLKCKWHDWKFCKNTGKCLTFPIKGRLSLYDFEIKPNNLNKYSTSIIKNKIYIKKIK